MAPIEAIELPEGALLRRYTRNGSYTDCYYMDLPGHVAMSEYISSFYTTRLFKIERKILALVAGKHSSDEDARHLARGCGTRFSAWSVEDRSSNQLLLCDFAGRTWSWLMAEPGPGQSSTRLYFGSAVVPKSKSADGKASFGFAFHALSGFHQLYTRALMRAAQAKLVK